MTPSRNAAKEHLCSSHAYGRTSSVTGPAVLGQGEVTTCNYLQTQNTGGRRAAQKYVCFADFTGDETFVMEGTQKSPFWFAV